MFLFFINRCLNLLYLNEYLEDFSVIFTKHLLLDFTYTVFVNDIVIVIIL